MFTCRNNDIQVEIPHPPLQYRQLLHGLETTDFSGKHIFTIKILGETRFHE
jgi:hypothetical protein